jgi:hypothetical protein
VNFLYDFCFDAINMKNISSQTFAALNGKQCDEWQADRPQPIISLQQYHFFINSTIDSGTLRF